MLFDDRDLELASNQPRYHFVEWFVAIHLFHESGTLSLMKKYGYRGHPQKQAVVDGLPDRQREFLRSTRKRWHAQPPDLMLYRAGKRGTHLLGFVEVKGPRDSISQCQQACNAAIRRELKRHVAVVEVKYYR